MIEKNKISTSSPEWEGPVPSKAIELALELYKLVNRSGVLRTGVGSNLFSKAYFSYKALSGDCFKVLIKKQPELFASGHIIDIGANIGYTASLFSTALSNGFKVFAFEPEQNNFVQLDKFIQSKNLREKVVTVQAALGASKRKAKLWLNPKSHADHRIADENIISLENELEAQEVSMISFDDYILENDLQSEPIAFIKIDVQGYEGHVIRGMKKTLEKNANAVLVFEYFPYSMKQLGSDPNELILLLKSLGYHLQVLNSTGSFAPFDSKVQSGGTSGREYYDIFCQKSCN